MISHYASIHTTSCSQYNYNIDCKATQARITPTPKVHYSSCYQSSDNRLGYAILTPAFIPALKGNTIITTTTTIIIITTTTTTTKTATCALVQRHKLRSEPNRKDNLEKRQTNAATK